MTFTTTTCHEHKHPEFRIECDQSVSFEAPYLISWLENLVTLGKVLRAGETLQIGWGVVRIEPVDRRTLTLWELDYEQVPVQHVHSVTKTLLALRKQRGVVDSFGLAQKIRFPSMLHSAVNCTKFFESAGCMITRAPIKQKNDSGWVFCCLDETHDHDLPSNLERGYLYAAARAKPQTIDFLAMPEGSFIVLDDGGNLLAAKDEKDRDLIVRPGSYLESRKNFP